MNTSDQTRSTVTFYDLHPKPADMKAEILAGLMAQPKLISPKYFYDERGSKLFDEITQLPEYYPTRLEKQLLSAHSEELAACIGHDSLLVEFGSGSSEKIRILLEAIRPKAYMPLDISKEHLIQAAERIAEDYPWLDVHAACVDYSRPWSLPYHPPELRPVAFFPGSSIGNFEPTQALAFLRSVHHLVGQHGGILLGVDLRKEADVLHGAYNDGSGVTAAFNKNVLTHINRKLSANFEPENFKHHAFFNEELGRIEMHLQVLKSHEVQVAGQTVAFSEGELIHTENSYKYTVSQFKELAEQAGFDAIQAWQDEDHHFSIFFLTDT